MNEVDVTMSIGQTLHIRAGDIQFEICLEKKDGVSYSAYDASNGMALISEGWIGDEDEPFSLIEAQTSSKHDVSTVTITRD